MINVTLFAIVIVLKAQVECSGNMRASKEYREALSYGLCLKALNKIGEQ